MDGSSQAAVTPQGVRDGDPAVLAALVARRGPAVLAFCESVCEPDVVPHGVAEAFARFRALVVTVDDAGDVDPEAYLLGATRHAAASMARPPSDGRGVLRTLGRGTSPETYAAVPALLAARADSMLGREDLDRLSRLLERSPGCREVEAAFRRAERGYRSPPDRTLPDELGVLVVAAMQAAAPLAEPFLATPGSAVDQPTPEPLPEPEPVPEPVPEPAPEPEPEPAPEPESEWAPATALHEIPDPPAVVDPGEPAPSEPFAPPAEPVPEAEPDGLTGILPPGALTDLKGEDDLLTTPVARHRARRGLPGRGLPGRGLAGRGLPGRGLPGRGLSRVSAPRGGGLPLPRHPPAHPDETSAVQDHGPVYNLLLPGVAILVAVLVMLAIAGVFGGGDPAPATVVTPAAARTTLVPANPVVQRFAAAARRSAGTAAAAKGRPAPGPGLPATPQATPVGTTAASDASPAAPAPAPPRAPAPSRQPARSPANASSAAPAPSRPSAEPARAPAPESAVAVPMDPAWSGAGPDTPAGP